MSTIEAWRTRDPVRFVAHCVSAESGTNIQATPLQDGVGWILPMGATSLFVALDTGSDRLSIDVPLARIAERQRVPLLRTALELCGGPSSARVCLRDDLLLLRRVGRVGSFAPEALRHAFRELAEEAQRLSATLFAWFDARPPFPEEQRANLTWAAAGRARSLKSFSTPPGPVRSQVSPSVRAPAPPAPPTAVRPSHEPSAAIESAAWAAPPPPKLPESAARPIRDAEAIPDILSPSFAATTPATSASPASVPAPNGTPAPKNGGGAAKAGILPPAHDTAVSGRAVTPGSDVAAAKPIAGAILPPSPPVPAEMQGIADASGQLLERRSTRTLPFRRPSTNMPAVSPAPVSVRPPPMPEVELEPPSRQSVPSRPDVANSPADRLCQLLRDAQSLATALSFQERPGTMVLLIRSTVFRAILDFGDALPDPVAHLYRSTAAATRELFQSEGPNRRASAVAIAEPALLVMERLVGVRCHVPEEKPLHIDPLTTAQHAREHLGRYLREIERAPSDPSLRHFLALGALSELLVRTKLPAKTDQRLREIIAYAHRDGAKMAAVDLMMTALNRIVAQ